MTDVRAIPTIYNGVEFRSRLEARWAVFFDALGVRWEYEHEGFELEAGRYLPDFLLPDFRGRVTSDALGCWFEVKPPNSPPDERHAQLAIASKQSVIVARGMLKPGDIAKDSDEFQVFFPEGFQDLGYKFCVCMTCGCVGVQFDGRSERICKHNETDDKVYTSEHPRIVAAYSKALSFKFDAKGLDQ